MDNVAYTGTDSKYLLPEKNRIFEEKINYYRINWIICPLPPPIKTIVYTRNICNILCSSIKIYIISIICIIFNKHLESSSYKKLREWGGGGVEWVNLRILTIFSKFHSFFCPLAPSNKCPLSHAYLNIIFGRNIVLIIYCFFLQFCCYLFNS